MGIKIRPLIFILMGLVSVAGIVFLIIWTSSSGNDTTSAQNVKRQEKTGKSEFDLGEEGLTVPDEEDLEKILDHVHDFEKSVWEMPTCQQGGYYNNICRSCGIVECVTQEPLPHEIEDILIQEGNCMEDTIIRHICKMCGVQVESDTRYTPEEGHNWILETVDGVEVNCCVNCGVVR